jgi:two-component system chemotaxis sensor kinase CheA
MGLWVIRSLIFLSLALSVYVMVLTMERCRSEKRYNFIYCMVFLFCYTLGYFIEMTSNNTGSGIIAIKVMYIGACFMSPFFFFFVADYCEIKLKKIFYQIPMLIIPVLFYFLVATFDYHRLIYLDYFYDTADPIKGMQITPGPLYFIGAVYPIICIVLSCVILIRSITRQGRGRRFGLIFLLVSALAPVIANLAYIALSYMLEGSALAGINLTAFVMVISNFMVYYNILRNDIFDLAPKAYSITLDLIRDAFVVIDQDMNYVSCNKVAAELFPALGEFSKGRLITELENWPRELAAPEAAIQTEGSGDAVRHEAVFTLGHRQGRNYSGWINKVVSESGGTMGWVVLIQDITETVSLIRNIQAQRDEIAAMRDNLKEGLFLMDKEFRIQPSYSRALEDMLSGANFQGKSFLDMLAQSFNERELQAITDYFIMIRERSIDSALLEEINPLHEFSYISAETGKRKTLQGNFAPVDQESGEVFVLCALQDITAEAALAKKLAEEEARTQDEMRTLFEVMQVDQKVFNDFIEDTEYEFKRITELLRNKSISNEQFVISLYQSVHAIKSNALIVGLTGYGEKLHALEDEIKILRDHETVSFDETLHITMELEKRMQDKDRFLDIIKRLRNFSAAGGEGAKNEEAVFVEALTKACERVAADEQKKVAFKVEAFDLKALNRSPRREIKDILTQLARNAVYHGIETPEERKARGKDETGTVSLSVAAENGAIRVTLRDDGRGLDFDRIARKAEERGLLKNPEDKTNKQFLSNLIFSPGFSTSETENLHAGRGIGLNLVKNRLHEINGKIQIQSEKGRGMTFTMQIPLKIP